MLHSTNPNHPESKDPNPNQPPLTKDELYAAVEHLLKQATVIDANHKLLKDIRGQFFRPVWQAQAYLFACLTGALLVARGKLDLANRQFDSILASEPNNLPALMGRVRGRQLPTSRTAH